MKPAHSTVVTLKTTTAKTKMSFSSMDTKGSIRILQKSQCHGSLQHALTCCVM